MIEIKTLNCPNCGGSIPDTSKACGFCGSKVILSDDRNKFVLAGILCPKCGVDNKEQNRFCSKCGEKLFKACPKCNTEIHFDSIHCSTCGKNLDDATKEKEVEIVKIKEKMNRMALLTEEIKLLDEKIKPLELSLKLLGSKSKPFDGEDGISLFQTIAVMFPICSIVISFISYLIGNTANMVAIVLISSYLILLFLFCVLPLNFYGRWRTEVDSNLQKRSILLTERNVVCQEMYSLNNEIAGVKHRYHLTDEDL